MSNLKEKAKDVARSYANVQEPIEANNVNSRAEYHAFLAGVDWYEKEILKEAVEVYNFEEVWHDNPTAYADEPTRSATLINIRTIEHVSRELKLEALIKEIPEHPGQIPYGWFPRAIAVLGEKK